MSLQTINHQLAEIALERVDGGSFEDFAQAFWAAIRGSDFVPAGGTKDGGSDGFIAEGLFEETRVGHFMQASIQADYAGKIRHTAKRLEEVGRAAKSITYLTSSVIANIDLAEEELSDELGLNVKIRDRKYVTAQINDSTKTVEAFNSYLSPHLAFLSQIGGATTFSYSPQLPARALCVFLGQEAERRSGNTELLTSVTDSLILWSLEGTDPDAGKFMAKEEILKAVVLALPAAKTFFKEQLHDRLIALTKKDGVGGRQVRGHKGGQYCLPYETRELIKQENSEDEILKFSVSQIFRTRLAERIDSSDALTTADDVVEICHRTLQITFETQGLEMAHFVLGDEPEDYVTPTIGQHVEKAVEERQISGKYGSRVRELAMTVLRATFYASSSEEREFLGKLSKTYMLLFMLKNEPKIVDYFKGMTSEFYIYIGSDIVVRALSEYFLASEDQMTVNTIKILETAGSKIVLSEKCLDEVWGHLKTTDMEFMHNYQKIEPIIDLDIARNVEKILIRAYFYARLDPNLVGHRPSNWQQYFGNFCSFNNLHNWRGREELKNYLMEKFGFEFETDLEMMQGIDLIELEELTNRIVSEKHRSKHHADIERLLARNDALHVLRVYSKRSELRERSKTNPYGYKTWWLTQETSVRRATGPQVKKHGSFYMMRPEFLLHFIGLSPSEVSVRQSFLNVFPTLLGVRLSNRLKPDVFKGTIQEMNRVFGVDAHRTNALLHTLSNDLKSNFDKTYD